MIGFLYQPHRQIFSLNPESYISTPDDIKTGHTRNYTFTLPCLFMWMGLSTSSLVDPISFFYRLPTGMCAGPNFKIRASLMLT
jgi:hypothetical protein